MMQVLYFASIREQLGLEAEQVDIGTDIRNVRALIKHLCTIHDERWSKALSDPNLLVSVNQELSSLDTVLGGMDEVAFFPPVTGG